MQSQMAHSMYLHGHHFQVTALGVKSFAGPMRETVLVTRQWGGPGGVRR
jgi:FtsP/CotA-like multicopper oxidase with cupredoxin domain